MNSGLVEPVQRLFKDFGPVDVTMTIYIVLGIAGLGVATPLMFNIVTDKGLNSRKEFQVMAAASFVDSLYVAINVINSAYRIFVTAKPVTRGECIVTPTIFTSTVISQLYGQMPLFVAIDRLLALKFGNWYYAKKTLRYIYVLVLIPLTCSLAIAIINAVWIKVTSADLETTSSLCFSSSKTQKSSDVIESTVPGLIHKDFQYVFFGVKWFDVIFSTVVFGVVLYFQHNDPRLDVCSPNWKTTINSAYRSTAASTLSSLVSILLPDALLLTVTSKTLVVTTVLYSMQLLKLPGNILAYIFLHKEVREIYRNFPKRSNSNVIHVIPMVAKT
uniref:G_PROTEIN_RECEP_F1_2 domain-containing protein n=1 Tax=Caenorhabditis tropicalis TaxID=1561998 RepID=A0A1I7TPZ4_9PELO